MTKFPAVSLAAVPGRRKQTLALAGKIEAAQFSGIFCPSFGDNLALCEALALTTKTIKFGTSITPIYTRNVYDFAQQAAFIHEISDGRFYFGIGVSHEPAMSRLGIQQGRPLHDIKNFIADLKAIPRTGDQPPVVIASLRQKMIKLASEVADGLVFANASLSYMTQSLSALPDSIRNDEGFFIGNMVPTVISDDLPAAQAVCKKILSGYVILPNYRNYWKEAGYHEEMEAIEAALAEGNRANISEFFSERWLSDVTLTGPINKVREGIEAWFDAGVRTPILVPSSVNGGQLKAFEELFQAFS